MRENNSNASSVKIVLDTSVIINGFWEKIFSDESLKDKKIEIVVPKVVVAEIEYQANIKKDVGYAGLKELEKMKEYKEKGIIKELKFVGRRPTLEEIKLSKGGELDNLIREAALEQNAILVTADVIQATIARIMDIPVKLLQEYKKGARIILEDFFDEKTMSVHLKEDVIPLAKKGKPGHWKLVKLGDSPLTREDVNSLALSIIEKAKSDERALIEIDEPGAVVIQMGRYRIAICRPPFSERVEITAVRPITKIRLEDYNLSERLVERLKSRAEGILIAGPPGAGKTTFAQALADFYQEQGNIVKTIEKPRDLQVKPEVTQYTALAGDLRKTASVLLLVRPDYTIFDEMRLPVDFDVFTDLRFGGVGMVGVVHASSAIDAIHRFIGKVELGQLSHVIDTVIFIKAGTVDKVYSLELKVKVPTGMTDEDLARPVVEVRDFETGELEYEIYTFGEEVVVAPVKEVKRKCPAIALAEKYIREYLEKAYPNFNIRVKMVSDTHAILEVSEEIIPKLIGKKGKTIEKLEKKFGISLTVRPLREKEKIDFIEGEEGEKIPLHYKTTRTHIILTAPIAYENTKVIILADDQPLFSAIIGKKGLIKIRRRTKEGKNLAKSIAEGKKLYMAVM
ncbi:MAG: Flp pilus assembly complex ATPase component TadA [Candidatus Odinarchaeota archaeon]|nr:Flp pilus assembly complex ATPase component TadA [Candidatus Odinarchaeota archaeon]